MYYLIDEALFEEDAELLNVSGIFEIGNISEGVALVRDKPVDKFYPHRSVFEPVLCPIFFEDAFARIASTLGVSGAVTDDFQPFYIIIQSEVVVIGVGRFVPDDTALQSWAPDMYLHPPALIYAIRDHIPCVFGSSFLVYHDLIDRLLDFGRHYGKSFSNYFLLEINGARKDAI